jgi:hypothetical protein
MTLSPITAKAALLLAVASTALGGGAGCMSRDLPSPTRVASSEAAIRTARELGAERIPDASVHLELAQRQLDRALRYVHEGDDRNAKWMLVRADADAHLALALTREARTKEAAEEMAARVRELSVTVHERSPDPM